MSNLLWKLVMYQCHCERWISVARQADMTIPNKNDKWIQFWSMPSGKNLLSHPYEAFCQGLNRDPSGAPNRSPRMSHEYRAYLLARPLGVPDEVGRSPAANGNSGCKL